MGKAVKWIKNLLTGNKEREKRSTSCPRPVPQESRSGPLPMLVPKEKRRWSFRRSSTGTRMEQKSAAAVRALLEPDVKQKRDAVAAAQAAVAVMRVTAKATQAVEDEAAITIQSFFRSYLARKALCALKGLVKLQALVRGQLVRREATATLRSMQALVNAQIRARAQRILMLDEAQAASPHRQNNSRRSQHEYRSQQSYEMEENVKILEIDHGEYRSSSNSRNSYRYSQNERRDLKLPTYFEDHSPYRGDPYREASPARSNLTDRSPRAVSGRFGEYSFSKGQSSPPYLSASSIPDFRKSSPTMSQDYPNYMANTESSRAKARSHSAPKQRPDSCERTPSRRRTSVEGKNILGGTRQRSSSHVSYAGTEKYQSIKLDRSSISLQESDCGSTSTLLTNTKYCRSLMAYEVRSEVSLNINS